MAMGERAGRVLVVVFAVRGDGVFRIISVRKANAREVRFYVSQG
ncbi:hypothetical protein PCS_03163 [Desulfocurvibacter africanus PCS]|uniref:BrnT family toxin n=1 Tax=Desulfocurvibacter africanus PCS TaxID=1262666 RepID=M5PQ01_DESAF|nr:BrnT family toxin [Desulfocurvibacter africanus]EMG36099.1 hypothetical protein PCS_03163 [Desulfocurvibacter africanus PCS]